MKKTLAIILALALAFALMLVPTTASAGQTVSGSGSYNGLTYQVYIPSSYQAGTPVPMYVMLHGCTQTASSFASATGMNKFAEQEGFIVLYVQQSSSNNMNSCFNWFETGDQKRGSGEPKDIYNIVTKVTSTYTVDENRIFVAGFSAGAYMAPVLGATYPDVYSGVLVNSGGAFKSATSMTSAFTVMSSGASTASSTIGSNIVSAMGSYKRVIPCIVFQGTSDYTVGSKNGTQAAESWAYAMNKIDSTVKTTGTSTNGTSSGGASFTRTAYTNGEGVEVVVLYMISGMGHAWSGGEGYSYAYSAGPSANKLSYEFFMNFWSGVVSAPSDGNTEGGGTTDDGTTGGDTGSTGTGSWMDSLPGMGGSSSLPGLDLGGLGGVTMPDLGLGDLGGVTMPDYSFDWSDWTGMFDWSSWLDGFDWTSSMGSWTDWFGSMDYTSWWEDYFGTTTDSWTDMWSPNFSGTGSYEDLWGSYMPTL